MLNFECSSVGLALPNAKRKPKPQPAFKIANHPNRDLTFGGTKPTGGHCGGKPNVPVVFVVSVNPSSSDDSVDLAVCVLVVLAKAT